MFLRLRLIRLAGLVATLLGSLAMISAKPPLPPRPNIVLIFCDDLGWGDLGCFGARGIRTPAIDRLAAEGTKFTSFYVSQPVCSASRASLLTGCYANRLGIHGALFPDSTNALSRREWTIARLLKPQGYATALFGKWHLGSRPEFLPTRHGFDEYFGLPYSNDMWPRQTNATAGGYPPLPLYAGENVLEVNPDQRFLTRRYTEHAVSFIDRHHREPFFLYLAHSMPHVPLHVSPEFAGKSAAGLYGDVIEELDWSVDQVLQALARNGLEENTWVIFTSDNGPWLSYGNHAGTAKPFREGKGTVFEGGIRVPCLMRWPGHIPRGRICAEPLMTMDLFPTIARFTGAPLPPQKIDGRDASRVIEGRRGARSPQTAYYFYYLQGELQAMRSGRWKLHFPHKAGVLNDQPGGRDGKPVKYQQVEMGMELYDLETDPAETKNVLDQHPWVVRRLNRLADETRRDLGDTRTKTVGAGVREPGRVGDARTN